MSQKHVTQMLEILNQEEPESDPQLENWDISTPAVLAIPDSFDLVPDELYDPVSDILNSTLGVHYRTHVTGPRTCEVVGHNGRWMFSFRLSES